MATEVLSDNVLEALQAGDVMRLRAIGEGVATEADMGVVVSALNEIVGLPNADAEAAEAVGALLKYTPWEALRANESIAHKVEDALDSVLITAIKGGNLSMLRTMLADPVVIEIARGANVDVFFDMAAATSGGGGSSPPLSRLLEQYLVSPFVKAFESEDLAQVRAVSADTTSQAFIHKAFLAAIKAKRSDFLREIANNVQWEAVFSDGGKNTELDIFIPNVLREAILSRDAVVAESLLQNPEFSSRVSPSLLRLAMSRRDNQVMVSLMRRGSAPLVGVVEEGNVRKLAEEAEEARDEANIVEGFIAAIESGKVEMVQALAENIPWQDFTADFAHSVQLQVLTSAVSSKSHPATNMVQVLLRGAPFVEFARTWPVHDPNLKELKTTYDSAMRQSGNPAAVVTALNIAIPWNAEAFDNPPATQLTALGRIVETAVDTQKIDVVRALFANNRLFSRFADSGLAALLRSMESDSSSSSVEEEEKEKEAAAAEQDEVFGFLLDHVSPEDRPQYLLDKFRAHTNSRAYDFKRAKAVISAPGFPFQLIGVVPLKLGRTTLVTPVTSSQTKPPFPVRGRYYFFKSTAPDQYFSILPDGTDIRRVPDARMVLQVAKQQFLISIPAPKQSAAQQQAMGRGLRRAKALLQQHLGTVEAADRFLELLDATKSVVAGSFIMQAILKEDWPNSDIDVWMPHIPAESRQCYAASAFRQLIDLLRQVGYRQVPTEFTGNQQPSDDYLGSSRMDGIQNMRVFRRIASPDIQLIMAKTHSNVFDLIETFDLTACQAMLFAGKVEMPPPYFQDLVDRRLRLSPGGAKQDLYEWARTARRIAKYIQRGFVDIRPSVFSTARDVIMRAVDSNIQQRHNVQALLHAADGEDVAASIRNKEAANEEDVQRIMYTVQAWNDSADLVAGTKLMPRFLYLPPAFLAMRNGAAYGSDYVVLIDETREVHTPNELRHELELVKEPEGGLPDSCYDVEAADFTDLPLSPDLRKKQIVILDPSGQHAVCFDRRALARQTTSPDQQMFQCLPTEAGTFWPSLKTMSRTYYIILSHSSGSFYVTQFDILRALFSGRTVFQLRAGSTIERTAGRTTIEQLAFVSGDHCQEGTDKTLYTLLGVIVPGEEEGEEKEEEEEDEPLSRILASEFADIEIANDSDNE